MGVQDTKRFTHWNLRKDGETCSLDGCTCHDKHGCESCDTVKCYCMDTSCDVMDEGVE